MRSKGVQRPCLGTINFVSARDRHGGDLGPLPRRAREPQPEPRALMRGVRRATRPRHCHRRGVQSSVKVKSRDEQPHQPRHHRRRRHSRLDGCGDEGPSRPRSRRGGSVGVVTRGRFPVHQIGCSLVRRRTFCLRTSSRTSQKSLTVRVAAFPPDPACCPAVRMAAVMNSRSLNEKRSDIFCPPSWVSALGW